ncbi:hypothetical protein, partial [Candidatus Enterococcus wittei]|uniref:hypothetical protein n=1 Tax=Candidatus Enterococcus wittei TaxID=1987383 RepID=UPI001C4E5210
RINGLAPSFNVLILVTVPYLFSISLTSSTIIRYTHLDVYKRHYTNKRSYNQVIKEIYDVPVSYTHLDVYKRQGISIGDSTLSAVKFLSF